MNKKFDFTEPRVFETASVKVSAFRHQNYVYVIRERKVTEPVPNDPNCNFHLPEVRTFLLDELFRAIDCLAAFIPKDEIDSAMPRPLQKCEMATLLHAAIRKPVEELLVETYWEAVERLGLDKDNENELQARYADLCGVFPIGGMLCLFTEEENIYIEDMSMELIVSLITNLSDC